MKVGRLIFLLSIFSVLTCSKHFNQKKYNSSSYNSFKGALLTTHFESYDELKKLLHISYQNKVPAQVEIKYNKAPYKLSSSLKTDITEINLANARDGNLLDKLKILFRSPYSIINRNDMQRVYILARRKGDLFGEGDVAFYDIAEAMVYHIDEVNKKMIKEKDFTEKGYINTFNHITAQAIMTTLFSEDLADFIADCHERARLPELITGKFTDTQVVDINEGPVDNYVDIINNEIGQEIGKELKCKYKIHKKTRWSPELLKDYLNDIQSYLSWDLKIGFSPFRSSDELILRFATKINCVLQDNSKIN